jgi:hypothetical protein
MTTDEDDQRTTTNDDDETAADDAADAQRGRWTVKGVSLRSRILAMSCARRAQKPAGAWLEWAIDLAAERQGQHVIMPPKADRRADSENAPGGLSIPPALIALAALARQTTPAEGERDSAALRAARSVVRAHLNMLRDELPRDARADRPRQVATRRAALAAPAPEDAA